MRKNEFVKEAAESPAYENYDEVFESLGWHVEKDKEDGNQTLSQHSPAGEDFSFEISGSDIPGEVCDFADDFDVDEHIDILAPYRGEYGVPTSYRALVEDAEAIQATLDKLAEALKSVQTNCDLGLYDCATCCIHSSCDREEDEDEEDGPVE